MSQRRMEKQDWGKLIHRTSKKGGCIRQIIILSLGLFIAIILFAGFWVGKIILGFIGLLMVIILLSLIAMFVRKYKVAHVDVFEEGIWFPYPMYWLWEKRPCDKRYFRSFDDIINVKKEVRGSYHIYIDTKSEGKLHFTVYKKQGPELMEAIIKAMSEYEKNKN